MVIVTTAVYRVLGPLNRDFKYLHWAELTAYTNLFRFASSYVFKKQSKAIGFLDLLYLAVDRSYSEVTSSICRIPLEELFRHLSLLSQNTCVSFSTSDTFTFFLGSIGLYCI